MSKSCNNPEVDDSSTVFDADTVTSDEDLILPSMPTSTSLPPFPLLVTTTENHHQQPNNNNNETISSTSGPNHPSQEESPANTISELLRRINSQPRPAVPASATSTEKKDISITSSSHKSTKGEHKTYKARWRSKFQQLCAYKQQYGNTNVLPSRNKQLGNWVYTQRVDYKKLKENKKSPMTLERIQLLESIGFEWVRSCRSWYQSIKYNNMSGIKNSMNLKGI
eukprot:CAMPEP_0178958122 /NCGR_PEP_ID=MMETSP0789-20121207/11400_1 /TAXON_ID=3005 /ORGANISM="Rhizosolenia setigera, Strain CCMP 1694" /LENGTH=223 /DNA_ID=CAMNT_0020640659 /DNA_START=37 /DNA_END=708 /DNA_ORIENTATION=+